MAVIAFGVGGVALAAPISAAETCNKDAHAAGPLVREEGTGGVNGEFASGAAKELGGIGQFTGPGNSSSAAECRAAKQG